MNRIVITHYNNQFLILFIKDNLTYKIRALNNLSYYPDSVYIGRVKNVKSNIAASFVNFNNGNIGFINCDSRKPETVFPVMVKKKSSGNKEDALTDIISISGIYCVVGNSIKGIKKSKKLNQIDYGEYEYSDVIFRTNSVNIDKESVYNEYLYLKNMLNEINMYADKRTENSVLYHGMPEFVKTIFSEDISDYQEILTDSNEIIDIYSNFCNKYKDLNINVPLNIVKYDDKLVSLNAFISLSSKLDDATLRKVYLKSDAYIVIDYTEAMTVIDVNSGTTKYKGNKDDVIHRINMEAAKEIARQLKLRNISGIIIVDFINVTNKSYNDELLQYINSLLKNDDCNARCHGITKLSLVEITRDRKDLSLREQLKNGSSTDKQ